MPRAKGTGTARKPAQIGAVVTDNRDNGQQATVTLGTDGNFYLHIDKDADRIGSFAFGEESAKVLRTMTANYLRRPSADAAPTVATNGAAEHASSAQTPAKPAVAVRAS